VTGHAVCLQIHGLAEDIGIVSSIVFPGALHDFIIVLRLGNDVDKRAYAFLVLGPFYIGEGFAIILKAEGNFFSLLSGRHNRLHDKRRRLPFCTGALLNVYNGSLLFLDHIQTLSFHLEFRISEPHTFQQEIPVNPFENQLDHMVCLRVLQKTHGSDRREGEAPDNRFGVVVEIDSVGFPEA
jgi:hypothetical protein